MEKTESRKGRILYGPPLAEPLDERSLGIIFYEKLKKLRRAKTPAFIHASTGEKVSYGELFEKSCHLAAVLSRYGVERGCVISVYSENSLYFAYPVLAALYLGTVVAPINPDYTIRELLHVLNIAKPKLIFCSKHTLDKVLQVEKDYPFQKIIVLDSETNVGEVESLEQFIMTKSSPSAIETFLPVNVNTREHVCFIMCSSGTTGLPKGVMITHRNVICKLAHGNQSNRITGFGAVNLIYLPLYHAIALQAILYSIQDAATAVIFRKFDFKLLLMMVEKYKVTELIIVPPIAILFAKSPLVDKYDTSSLKSILCGAAPLDKEVEDVMKKRLKLEAVCQGYGMTETTVGVIMPIKAKPGSVGVLESTISAKVIDPKTKEILGPYQRGELCFKGEIIMKGYVNNPEATKEAIDEEGWLHTGDIGYYDDEEYFFIVDRLKELIKCKGFQVAPAELEAILLRHPKVQDAGVVGIPDPYYGEKPIAFVVKYPAQQLEGKEVLDFVNGQISRAKKLHEVRFIDAIPKNSSGKILRRKLKELAKQKSKL